MLMSLALAEKAKHLSDTVLHTTILFGGIALKCVRHSSALLDLLRFTSCESRVLGFLCFKLIIELI